MNDILQYGLLIIVGMLAGVINTLAGGGSLLTLPVLIFMGLPPNVANATNRIGIAFQALIGTAGYRSKGVSNFPFNIYLGISALIGSLIGAQIAVDIKGETFNKLLAIIMLFVVAVIVFKPKASSLQLPERLTGKYLFYAIIGFFFIGIYGGFINAGIGFVIILFLNNVNRLSLIKTNATKVSLVFIYTCGALALFDLELLLLFLCCDLFCELCDCFGTELSCFFIPSASFKADVSISLILFVAVCVVC